MAMMVMTLNHETGRMLAVAVSMGWLFLIFATSKEKQSQSFRGVNQAERATYARGPPLNSSRSIFPETRPLSMSLWEEAAA
jgi:hypothetical protein